MELLGPAIVLGVLCAAFWMTRARRRPAVARELPGPRPILIRAVEVETDPYRTNAAERIQAPPARVPQPARLAHVVEAVRAKGLAIEAASHGFTLATAEADGVFRVRVSDPEQVSPLTWTIEATEAELAIDLAHALVPTFGPLAVDFGAAGWITVDGTRDVASLRKELSERFRVMLSDMANAMRAMFGDPTPAVPAEPATPLSPYVIDDSEGGRRR